MTNIGIPSTRQSTEEQLKEEQNDPADPIVAKPEDAEGGLGDAERAASPSTPVTEKAAPRDGQGKAPTR